MWTDSPVLQARARYGALVRHRGLKHPDTQDAHRVLATEKLAQVISETLTGAPSLTPAQRRRLTKLVRESGPA